MMPNTISLLITTIRKILNNEQDIYFSKPGTNETVEEVWGDYRRGNWNDYGLGWAKLYGNGEVLAMHIEEEHRSVYFGKDILGTVKGISEDNPSYREQYEYDVFGNVYSGALDGQMNLGYLSKEYNGWTEQYNYGYRYY
jgi:hypothetical protein